MPRILPVLLLFLLAPRAGHAEGPPLQPPCGGPSQPVAAAHDRPPTVAVWNESALSKAGWQPPACLNWTSERTRLAVALAGEFRFAGTVDDLLARFGVFSAYKSIRYWSVSSQSWQTLVSDSGPDMRASDLVAGSSFDYFENDRAGHCAATIKVRDQRQSG